MTDVVEEVTRPESSHPWNTRPQWSPTVPESRLGCMYVNKIVVFDECGYELGLLQFLCETLVCEPGRRCVLLGNEQDCHGVDSCKSVDGH